MNLNANKTAIITTTLAVAFSAIVSFEGNALQAYYDVNGIPTICAGITYGVKITDKYTAQECDDKTLEAVKTAYKIFTDNVPENVREKLTAKTQAAYTSFIYNVGPGAKNVKSGFVWLKNGRHSTMYKQLLVGNLKASCNEFSHWVYAGGRIYRGLVRRRKMEEILCLDTLK